VYVPVCRSCGRGIFVVVVVVVCMLRFWVVVWMIVPFEFVSSIVSVIGSGCVVPRLWMSVCIVRVSPGWSVVCVGCIFSSMIFLVVFCVISSVIGMFMVSSLVVRVSVAV